MYIVFSAVTFSTVAIVMRLLIFFGSESQFAYTATLIFPLLTISPLYINALFDKTLLDVLRLA